MDAAHHRRREEGIMSTKKKCDYCAHREKCDIEDADDRAACKLYVVSFNTSQEQARRRRQMKRRAKR
jgi:hypothetical protein